MRALAWEGGITSFGALAGKYLAGVSSDRKETGASKGHRRIVMALPPRSLGSDVGTDRDCCAVVIELILSSMGVVSFMKTLTSHHAASNDETQLLLDTTV